MGSELIVDRTVFGELLKQKIGEQNYSFSTPARSLTQRGSKISSSNCSQHVESNGNK